jgi:hypothetical protein
MWRSNDMNRDDDIDPHGMSHDRMIYEALQWKSITLWGIRDPENPLAYVRFEVYSVRKYVTYRLMLITPSEKSHPSSWNLDIIRFGDKKTSTRVSNNSSLQSASFEELFAVMGVLMDEEENPNLMDYISKRELERLKRKWHRWMRDLPDWLTETIRANTYRAKPMIKRGHKTIESNHINRKSVDS